MTAVPAARAALPIMSSLRVRLKGSPRMPLTHAADQVRGRPAQACWCPRCLRDQERRQASWKAAQLADGVRREQESPRRDSKAPTGLEQLVPDIERRFVQPGAALDHSRPGVQLQCRQRALQGQFHRRLRSRRSSHRQGRHDQAASRPHAQRGTGFSRILRGNHGATRRQHFDLAGQYFGPGLGH